MFPAYLLTVGYLIGSDWLVFSGFGLLAFNWCAFRRTPRVISNLYGWYY